jgi:dUTP pyrophosphatase
MVYGEIYRVPTGIAVEIPEGYEGQIRPRSSLAARGIIILNAPGTIDSDYRGEIQVLMYNLMHTPYQIVPGDRIAQLVITKVARTHIQVVEELTATERDTGGFGSTGR